MGSADITELEKFEIFLSSCPQMFPPGSNNLTLKENFQLEGDGIGCVSLDEKHRDD